MSFNRREPRLRAQVPVLISIGKKTVTASTEDVSYHGLYVAIDERPALRQLIRVEVQLNRGTETFQTHATVVRHADDYGKVGVGLEFFGRTESATWDSFVQEVQRNPPPIVENRGAPRPPPQPSPLGGPGTDPNRLAPMMPGTDPNRLAPAIPGEPPRMPGTDPNRLAPMMPGTDPNRLAPAIPGEQQRGSVPPGPPDGRTGPPPLPPRQRVATQSPPFAPEPPPGYPSAAQPEPQIMVQPSAPPGAGQMMVQAPMPPMPATPAEAAAMPRPPSNPPQEANGAATRASAFPSTFVSARIARCTSRTASMCRSVG